MKSGFIRLLIASILTAFFAPAHAWATPQLWTCGMHPQIIREEPGNCPICGMKLVPVHSGAGAIKGDEQAQIHIDAVTIQRMNLKTSVATRGAVDREIRTVGSVALDEAGLRDITIKYEGWIEKLFVNSTWAEVKAGDPLFEIYSPDLFNAELNLLVARRGEPDGDGPLTRAALGRLRLFDVPQAFIDALAQSGQAQRTFVFRAPSDGVVVEKMAVEGQMMKPGERIYRLADLSKVWVLGEIYETDLPFVHVGDMATVHVTYGEDRTFSGPIALLSPEVQAETRAATARIVLANPDLVLRPGMFVDVRLAAHVADAAVLVPETAILRSGERNTVFIVRDGGAFEPREVKLGARTGSGDYEVISGLQEGERVVTSGQFMLDSESQIQEAIAAMTKPAGSNLPVTGAKVVGGSVHPAAAELATLADATADIAEALAADDLDQYNQKLAAVNSALSVWKAAEGRTGTQLPVKIEPLPAGTDLVSARANFESFSTAVADLSRAARLTPSAELHLFECPMPPSNSGKARWLQRTAGTKNPFYGSKMPDCGGELR